MDNSFFFKISKYNLPVGGGIGLSVADESFLPLSPLGAITSPRIIAMMIQKRQQHANAIRGILFSNHEPSPSLSLVVFVTVS